MSLSDRICTAAIYAFFAGALITVSVCSFKASTADWCAHPDRPGNWIVQPFCKG